MRRERSTDDKELTQRRKYWNTYERNGHLADIASGSGDYDDDYDDDGDW